MTATVPLTSEQSMPMRWRVGVDSGGTFTDVCLFEARTGRFAILKVPSSPADPSIAILEAVEAGCRAVGASYEEVDFFGHGTTVGTNALIQLRGCRVGLITTRGFGDLLEIGRQMRPHLYDNRVRKPKPLAAAGDRFEIDERIDFRGNVEIGIDEEQVRTVVSDMRAAGIEAIAVCLLFSFLNPQHERSVKDIIKQEWPDVFVSTSHEVAPEFREYERLSTTVANSYLGPVLETYIDRLAAGLHKRAITAPAYITQSSGGVLDFVTAKRNSVRTLLSGPSTGVVAAQEICRNAGFQNVITFDMGGTSTDVALISDGVCASVGEGVVHGYPIKAPMLDINTAGTGGGSIASVDAGGLLKVGPQSAGADPGPACYGRGNDLPTVSDANVVLQILNPAAKLGGNLSLLPERALDAVRLLGESLGLDPWTTAQGIISVATANMAKAIRVISVQRGHDLRDFTLMAFGGAGPLHAARLAKELNMPRVLIPRTPGTFCALGLLLTDLKNQFAQTTMFRLDDEAGSRLAAIYATLQDRASAWFDSGHVAPDRRRTSFTADMRYVGQGYELNVQLEVPDASIDVMALARQRFEAGHRRAFGFHDDKLPIEFVTIRLDATGIVDRIDLSKSLAPETTGNSPSAGHRPIWLPETGAFVDCPVYDREAMHPGFAFIGPAVVEQLDTTTFVPEGWNASVDAYENIILERSA